MAMAAGKTIMPARGYSIDIAVARENTVMAWSDGKDVDS
jgi:hypothetical protein